MVNTSNFGLLFSDAVKTTPNKIALIGTTYSLTYRELDRRTNQAAHLFRSLGIKKGDRVALLFPNHIKFLEVVYGVMRIGGIPVPINIKLPYESIHYILADSGAKILFYHQSLSKVVNRLRTRSSAIEHFISANDGKLNTEATNYELLLRKQSDRLIVETVAADDLCYLPYTSGSTGFPKGCKLTHGGQYWNADMLRNVREINQDERLLIFAPIYHANAMVNIQSTLLAGGSIVILPRVEAAAIFQAIERYRVTFMTGVPTIYKMLLAYYQDHHDFDLTSLKFVLCGSSALSPETIAALNQNFHVDVLESYGLTEGGPVVFSSRRKNGKGNALMQKLPQGEIKIVQNGKEVLNHTIGELWVKNPGVAAGYWHLPKVDAEKYVDGWLKTGDLVKVDQDGNAYIVGRKDDMINIGGENAYPKEIENIILQYPGVEDVVVVAIAHALKGQVPAAVIVPKINSKLTEKELQTFFFAHGPAYAYPRRCFFVDHLPLAGTGKVDKAAVNKWVRESIQATND